MISDAESDGWNDGAWLYPRAVKLLRVEKYRTSILAGLVVSVGTRTASTVGVNGLQRNPFRLNIAVARPSLV